MNILFVAPQPFLVNRGTPIAVKEMTQALGSMGHNVDILTYHLGENPEMKNVRICRIPKNPIKNVPTAFSINKLILDVPLTVKFIRMVLSGKYDVIHCVEESVFIALFTKWLHRTPFIFDIDSSMPDQLAVRGGFLKMLNPFFIFMEKWAIKRSLCCITVCKALSDNVRYVAPRKAVFQIEDLPLVPDKKISEDERNILRNQMGITDHKLCCYMGNFSRYQGIDLMFNAFKIAKGKIHKAKLLIIGGSDNEVIALKKYVINLNISEDVIFEGKKSPEESANLLQTADVLISPRIEGTNTPMKIYTYMASGIPIVATKLSTHTQVLDKNSAVLVGADANKMADGIIRLFNNPEEGRMLAKNAAMIIEKRYSKKCYLEKLSNAYKWIKEQVK